MKYIGMALFVWGISTNAFSSGQETFNQQCAACHQKSGEGIPGAFPALKGNTFVKTETTQLIDTILYGRAGMPSFKSDLDDASLNEVIGFIKTSWGNEGEPVSISDIAAIRAAKEGHEALARQN